MRRPLVAVALAFIAGIAFHNFVPLPISLLWTSTILTILLCVILLRIDAPSKLRTTSVLFLIFLSGYLYHHSRFHSFPQDHISNFASSEKSIARLRGIVKEPPIQNPKPVSATDEFHPRSFTNTRTTFPLDVESLNCNTQEKVAGSRWVKVSGRIKVRVYDDVTLLRYGDRVEIVGKLFTPRPPTNPGQFDYKMYLRRNGVTAMLTTLRKENIEVLARGKGNIIFQCIYRLKRRLNEIIKKQLSSPASSVLSCLLLGNRHEVPDEIEQNFMRTGTIHFLAISGLHVGISAGALWLLLRLFGIRRRIAAGVVLIFVCIYAVLTGMRPSILRAGIMAAALCTGFLARRQWDLVNSIALSAIVVLLINPSQLFNAGFQLSYAAVLSIVFFSDDINRLLFGGQSIVERLQSPEERSIIWYYLNRYLKVITAISIAAWIGTIPLIAYYYHTFTPLIVPLNIIVFPLVWFMVAFGFIFVIVGLVFGALAVPLSYLISQVAFVLVRLVKFAAELPLSHFYLPGPSFFWVIIYYSFAMFLICRRRFNIRLTVIVIIGAMLMNAYVYLDILQPRIRSVDVTCLDVGKGSATVIQFPNGKTILYDVGTMGAWDVGEYVAAPFLWHSGIRTLNAVVLSHSDSDHCSGVVSIFERFKVDKLLVNRMFGDSNPGRAILKAARRYGINPCYIADGDRLEGFGEAKVEVMNPPRQNRIVDRLTPNDSSCVLRITYKGESILLCGDIQWSGIQLVLERHDNLRADVIQSPHHGGYIVGNMKLLQKVQPRYALISADHDFPSQQTLDDYARLNIKVFRTSEHGAITVKLGKSIVIVPHN